MGVLGNWENVFFDLGRFYFLVDCIFWGWGKGAVLRLWFTSLLYPNCFCLVGRRWMPRSLAAEAELMVQV